MLARCECIRLRRISQCGKLHWDSQLVEDHGLNEDFELLCQPIKRRPVGNRVEQSSIPITAILPRQQHVVNERVEIPAHQRFHHWPVFFQGRAKVRRESNFRQGWHAIP